MACGRLARCRRAPSPGDLVPKTWPPGEAPGGCGRGRPRAICWLLPQSHVVVRHLRGEEPAVEPVDDVLPALDAVPGLAGAGELVRLAGEADHHHRPMQVLERA